tara:strand:- start:730 stop:2712 length:1983 start_codon:yes stop_codon:yes gene_type:complete
MRDNIKDILNLVKLNKFKEAQIKCEGIYIRFSKNVKFLHLYGFIFFNLKNYDQAINFWTKAVTIDPKFVDGLNNLGNAFSKINRFDEAVKYLNRALKIKPDFFESYFTLSEIFYKQNKFQDSLLNLNQALKLKPKHLQTIKNKVQLLAQMNKKSELLNFLNEVIPYHPQNTELYSEKAKVLLSMGMKTQSINTYKTIYMLDPDFPDVLGSLVSDKLSNCEWDGIEKDFVDIKKKINEEKDVVDPFTVSLLFDSADLQNKSAKIWIKQYPILEEFKRPSNLNNKKKINLGYFSADFRNHPVGHLISKILETHDKSKFDLYGFYFSDKKEESDKYYLRIKKAFKKFYHVSDMSDSEIITLSKNLNIDIAVDLMAHTGSFEDISRFGVFHNKCAPIQINFLGYPGTSASKNVDYIIADQTVIPEKNKKFFSEKIIFLPHSYQPSERTRNLTEKKITKEELCIPENEFVFCCFNTNKKILPNILKLWSEILKEIPKSILWLLSDNETFKKNLKFEFEKKNINPQRIIFSKKVPIHEHLSRIKHADLFLDTFPYNAHTTCSDSIWAGVPLLTLEGQSFQSRVATSLLKTSGLDELIAKDENDYVKKAVHLAKNREYLDSLKNKLKNSRDTNPLFDNKTFTKNIEKAYNLVFEKYIKNEETVDIYL